MDPLLLPCYKNTLTLESCACQIPYLPLLCSSYPKRTQILHWDRLTTTSSQILKVINNHPLPHIDNILANCTRGTIWATIDMTDSFFQTKMHLDDVYLTAVSTPFGLYKWMVMPMRLQNTPAIYQRWVTLALHQHIGRICHIYIDDIVIWSSSLEEHARNIETILKALQDVHLDCNKKKTKLFTSIIDFLGHTISTEGISTDKKKVEKVITWPCPCTASDVRAFLRLVWYLATFLPKLAVHTDILTPLTTKEADKCFPKWDLHHEAAF